MSIAASLVGEDAKTKFLSKMGQLTTSGAMLATVFQRKKWMSEEVLLGKFSVTLCCLGPFYLKSIVCLYFFCFILKGSVLYLIYVLNVYPDFQRKCTFLFVLFCFWKSFYFRVLFTSLRGFFVFFWKWEISEENGGGKLTLMIPSSSCSIHVLQCLWKLFSISVWFFFFFFSLFCFCFSICSSSK